jgi:signal transduction histidine kinase/CheY-like chemotaxis protein/HPt (histidine-containing phosphotransfer) domain-containing protein
MMLGLLVVLAIQAFLLHHSNSSTVKTLANGKIHVLLSIQAANQSEPLWNYDLDQVRRQNQTALEDTMIIGARVIEETGSSEHVVATAGVASSDAGYESLSMPVMHAEAGGTQRRLGRVEFLIDYAPMREQVTRLTLTTTLTALAAFAVVAAMVYGVLARAIAPVTRLSQLLSRDDAAHIEPSEIGAIRADTLEVANLISALRHMHDNTAKYHNDLLQAKEGAEKANRAKTDFLANMSHELRTPLNSIIGLVELLSESKLPQEALESLAVVEVSSKNLLHIVNDILDISKIESASLELESIPFHPIKALQTVMQMLRPQASARGTAMNAEIQIDEDLAVLGDPNRFMQVFINLVGNAVKYTDRGRILMTARDAMMEDGRHRLIIEVSDTGIGIAKDKLERIFDKFMQADNSITRKYGGSGLGLTITRQLIQLMGGEIWVESALGLGSRFTVSIPFKATRAGHAVEERIYGNQAGADAIPAAEARVLLAEDHQMNQMFMKKLLSSLGLVNLRIVDNGQAARDAAAAGEADIVLMDCHMPGMSGYDAAVAIRRGERENRRGRMPIVAMTANAMQGERENCLDHGMDDYISKPVDRRKMVSILSRWIRFSDKVIQKNLAPPAPFEPLSTGDLPLLRMEILDQTLMGDEDAKRQMASVFDGQTRMKLAELEAECTDGINVAWKEKAHFLKGGAAQMGAERLRKLCEDAQGMVDSTAERRRNMLKRMTDVYAETARELKNRKLLD